MSSIAVIDYGMGNLHSIAKALHKVTTDRIVVSYDAEEIRRADRVVFPGVGGMAYCMAEMQRLGLDEAMREVCAEGKPVLGVCVGMQALMDHSRENDGVDALGVLPGRVKRFKFTENTGPERLKVPQMGWNRVQQTRPHPLWKGIEDGGYYYFVHSYYVDPVDSDLTCGETTYGRTYTSAIGRDNVFAVQFHPEKSAQMGLALLHNFCQWDGQPE